MTSTQDIRSFFFYPFYNFIEGPIYWQQIEDQHKIWESFSWPCLKSNKGKMKIGLELGQIYYN